MSEPISLTREHLPRLLELCTVALPLDVFSLRLLEHRVFADPRVEPGLTLGIEDAGRLVAAAIAVVRPLQDGSTSGWLKLLAVDPACRRQGMASRLLAALEKRCRGLGAARMDTIGAPYYLWPGVDVRYTPACCLLEQLGWSEYRYTVNMAVDLTAQRFEAVEEERRLADQGYRVARADAASLPAVLEFIRGEWPLWAEEAPIAMLNTPASLFYLARGERALAFAAYDAAMFPGTFGPMGTDAALRGQGAGGVLLKRCLRDMKDLGYPRCEIAWTGPVAFYARQVNAHICRVFRGYRKDLS